MADPRLWSNDEKNELLAEIIKTASPHPSILLNVIASQNIQPRWEETPLPRGRSLNACRIAFNEIQRTQSHPLSLSSYGPPHTPLSAVPPGVKRPHPQSESATVYPTLRPKPPYNTSSGVGQMTSSEPPAKRKRGRPTKAAMREKALAQATASAEAGPAPPFSQISPPMMAPLAITTATSEETKPSSQPTSRMPISAVLTPTGPKTTSSSSSSSGKRRRGRSTRSEPEGFRLAGPSAVGGAATTIGGQEYESPYARAMGPATVPEDSPARTAVMRHREEPPSASQQRQPSPRPASTTLPPQP